MKQTEKDCHNTLYEVSSDFIRAYSYKHGKEIYDFMNKFEIGRSAYGEMMDAVGRTKQVLAHRLYGHHLIYDFPYNSSENILAFLEHELSDLFTKMGLPIFPGELLENTPLLKYCNKLTKNWNFVNGFDILAGTIAIWQGIEKVSEAFNYELTIDTFSDFAKTFGVGALELAIALSSANPFLLLAAGLHLTSGIRGLFNDGATIIFRKNIKSLLIEFSLDCFNIKEYIKTYNINNEIDNFLFTKTEVSYSIGEQIKKYNFKL
ncbi:MAG: hypothetical protein LBB89_11590 [Treponema sp.]|nr:hypothetical protein [Treponema sp.]